MHTYLITYQLDGSPSTVTKRIKAQDEACAMGLVLDRLEDDEDGNPPALVFVTMERVDLRPMKAMPPAVVNAWRAGIQG